MLRKKMHRNKLEYKCDEQCKKSPRILTHKMWLMQQKSPYCYNQFMRAIKAEYDLHQPFIFSYKRL
jgi:hypothetical protein